MGNTQTTLPHQHSFAKKKYYPSPRSHRFRHTRKRKQHYTGGFWPFTKKEDPVKASTAACPPGCKPIAEEINVKESLKKGLGNMDEKLKEGQQNAINLVTEGITNVKTGATDKLTDVTSGISGFFAGLTKKFAGTPAPGQAPGTGPGIKTGGKKTRTLKKRKLRSNK